MFSAIWQVLDLSSEPLASAVGREILIHIVINVETLLSPEDNKFGSEDERGQTMTRAERLKQPSRSRESAPDALQHERSRLIVGQLLISCSRALVRTERLKQPSLDTETLLPPEDNIFGSDDVERGQTISELV